jgi:hypothetical protein
LPIRIACWAGWSSRAPRVSYGKTTSYLPVLDHLKRYIKIQDRDDLREIRENVTRKLLALDGALKPSGPRGETTSIQGLSDS